MWMLTGNTAVGTDAGDDTAARAICGEKVNWGLSGESTGLPTALMASSNLAKERRNNRRRVEGVSSSSALTPGRAWPPIREGSLVEDSEDREQREGRTREMVRKKWPHICSGLRCSGASEDTTGSHSERTTTSSSVGIHSCSPSTTKNGTVSGTSERCRSFTRSFSLSARYVS